MFFFVIFSTFPCSHIACDLVFVSIYARLVLSHSLSLSKNKRIILNWVSPASQGFFIEIIAYQNTVDRLVVCNLYSIQSYLKHLARSRLFISIYAAFEL